MKSIKKTLAVLFLTAAIMQIVSCKKDNIPNNPLPDKILGKWKLVSTVANDFYSGTSHITTYTWTSADYADFRTDGKLYSFVNNDYDTAAYAKISDTKMWIDINTDTCDIQTLTDTDLKFYRKKVYSATEYDEATVTMKK